MNTLGTRIFSKRKELSLSQEELASKAARFGNTTLTKQSLGALENDKTEDPKAKTIFGLAVALGVSVRWLLTGRGDSSDDFAESAIQVAESGPMKGYVRLPLLAMEASMGYGIEDDRPFEVIEHLDIAEWWAELNLPKPLDRVQIIVGRGDSNAPLINSGDIVFVDTRTSAFDGEGLYVFNFKGQALIKRLAYNMRTGGIRIVSANPAYEPEEVTLGEIEQMHISGRVVAWYTLRRN